MILYAIIFAAGVFTGLSAPKIVSWAKDQYAKIKAKV